jgi:hypothetical protein
MTTFIRTWEKTSQFRDDNGISLTQARDARRIYRSMREEGADRASARMNLVHAMAAGQRDMRFRIGDAMRNIG